MMNPESDKRAQDRAAEKAPAFSHLDDYGRARMVDTGNKAITRRTARASGRIAMSAATIQAIAGGNVAKGDVLAAARIAGIMAARKTADLIPLCHSLSLDSVQVDFEVAADSIGISATAVATGKTGVEMEALVAASIAALTIYDMCKSADRAMTIETIRLEEKTGGASGHFLRQEDHA